MSTFRRPSANKRARTSWPKYLNPLTLDAVPSAKLNGNNVTLTFTIPVVLKGTPKCRIDNTELPVSALQSAPNILALTFGGSVESAVSLFIPQRDPAVRTSTGGYMPQETIVFLPD